MEGRRTGEGVDPVARDPAGEPTTRVPAGERVAADRPAATAPRGRAARTGPATAGVPGARTHIPTSRGALAGTLLVILGIWGALIPFVGPYFNYEFGSDATWSVTWQRFWLDILPGVLLIVGGLMLTGSSRRPSAVTGAWIALAGAMWFVVGPVVSMLWHTAASPYAPIGAPIGSKTVRFLELIGFYYGLGALATALAAFSLGRLSLVAARDLEVAAERERVATTTAPAARI